MFLVKTILVLIFIREAVTPIREPASQIGKIKAIIESIVLVLTKLSFLCTKVKTSSFLYYLYNFTSSCKIN